MNKPSAQPPTTVTANIKMKVGDFQLDAQVTVPTKPTPLRLMLPMVHALADAVVDVAIKSVEEEGKTISCQKGCGACCRQLVPIAEIEARRLRDLVNDLPEPRRTAIRRRFAEAQRRLEAAGLWQKMADREHWAEGESNPVGLQYFAQGIACPFLEEESCSIHPDRPVSCREYLVTSPAANCAKPSAETVRMVPMPAKVWTALARLDAPPPGGKFIRWVPLIQSLAWADAHPDEPAERPGPDWLRDLFEHLSSKKPNEALAGNIDHSPPAVAGDIARNG
jgi:Fe-S-cluster containining protein